MRTITAFYDDMADAERAAQTLRQGGFGDDAIRVVDQGQGDRLTADATGAPRQEDRGFFGSLRDMFVADEDRYAYEEGIRRGGALLTARVEDEDADRAIELLDQTGAVDIDTRVNEWRASGWSGQESSTAGSTAYSRGTAFAGGGVDDDLAADRLAGSRTAAFDETPATRETSAYQATEDRTGDEVIQLVEEEFRVGKRETSRGTVRVRSYIVETPVQEDVTLRQERVSIERRPVDRAAGEITGDAFKERTIEATERHEEAVVEKTARVREELVLRKELDERTETIADSIRRTEVEIDDDRGSQRTTTESGTSRTRTPV